MVAGHIAAAIGAHKVVFLTDVDGLYENFENKDSLISNLTLFEAQYMVENNIVSTGMIPKLKSCIHALDSGVFRAHIINGITPHSLLLELLTSTGVGTTMHSTEESCTFDTHPLGNFAPSCWRIASMLPARRRTTRFSKRAKEGRPWALSRNSSLNPHT